MRREEYSISGFETAGRVHAHGVAETTIAHRAEIEGVGLHTGAAIRMCFVPAPARTGIVFRRTDLDSVDRAVTDIPARFDRVTETTLSTLISNEAGHSVGTIEHVMAAIAACGLDNVVIEVSGGETPVMDGSAEPFVRLIRQVGLRSLDARRRVIRVLRPVVVEEAGKRAALLPHADDSQSFVLSFEIEFDNPVIGHETFEADVSDPAFAGMILSARTFGFLKDVEAMWSMGLGRGGSLENSIVIDGEKVLNEGGLRYRDEFVRHKLLDALGDLSLGGAVIAGRYEGVRSGHALNNRLLRALLGNLDAWTFEDAVQDDAWAMGPVAIPAD
ncbi:MAG: UDP-3-O-acyl-N-acetylglucosamine deacetylase [Parvibaculaceae bacterium]|nr:UDP-3-O-acyl-N-acetylglucosamine deacetylase [Parvibaculaceae bacterium]